MNEFAASWYPSGAQVVEELGRLNDPDARGAAESLGVDLGEVAHRRPGGLLEHDGFDAEALDPVRGGEGVDDG